MGEELSSDFAVDILKNFLCSSDMAVKAFAKEASTCSEIKRGNVVLYNQDGKQRREKVFQGSHFFLRTSFEYSSPQLTLEELQGIIAARLLEVTANQTIENNFADVDSKDIVEMSDILRKPPSGMVIPFSLQTDDIESDRYSNNPLRASLIESGQSAFPVDTVSCKGLSFDQSFLEKYRGSLITDEEVEFGEVHLGEFERYTEFVDFFKNYQLSELGNSLGIMLTIPTLSIPLRTLRCERPSDTLHAIIRESHRSYETIEQIYSLMGRSMNKKSLVLAVPHSPKGFGSKRSARGKMVFSGRNLSKVKVKYRDSKLYPNMADPNDVSIAKAHDDVDIPSRRFTEFLYDETPSSPQFALYILLSPEDASLWHGVGAYAGSEILKSYSSIQTAFLSNQILEGVERPKICKKPAIALNLAPDTMWSHPTYGNIDASIGCIASFKTQTFRSMNVTSLSLKQYTQGLLQ